MAAPTPTTRQTPAGIYLEDGHSTLITLAGDPDISLWERTVTPPGIDGEDPVDVTTMHNTVNRTFAPRQLKTLTEMTTTAAYDPAVLTQLYARINIEDTITVTFPDGSTWAFYGYLRAFEPDEISEGEMPSATVTFQPTNWDYVNNTEEGPALVSVAGT